jgi:hypothetical protein
MHSNNLYEENILLWSEQQAAVIRRMGQTRPDLSAGLDIENIVEEIESVGKRELWAVEENIRSIFRVIGLLVESTANAAPEWRAEIIEFHCRIKDRYAPSMRQRIDMDDLWRSAHYQLTLAYGRTPAERDLVRLPRACPFAIDDMITDEIDSSALIERVQASNALSRESGSAST